MEESKMGIAYMIKYLIIAVVAFKALTFLTGCKPDEEAARKGHEITRDSPGWERVRQQEALPPHLRDKGGAPRGPVSSEWPSSVGR
jgi:hypothetical protein